MGTLRHNFPDLPPIWAAGFALAAVIAGQLLPPGPFDHAAPRILGLILIAAGLLLAAWAALWFRRKRTSIEPREVPRQLIVEGPFRINRNPIYTGMALVIFGAALLWGSWISLIIAALFPPLITARFIQGEEDTLRRAFGSEAETYIARTRRW